MDSVKGWGNGGGGGREGVVESEGGKEGWRGKGWGGMVGGERGRDWEGWRKGEEMEEWRGDGVVWSGIGRGAKLTHLGSNVACVHSCSSSPVSVPARRRPCPFMGAGRRSWSVVAVVAGGGSHARRSWVMAKGAGRHRRLCAVGSSWLSSPVSLRGQSASSRSNDSLGHVLACDVACHVIVVVVGGGCEQMAMVVGGCGCWQWW